jgi:hypothetical protein
MFTEEVTVVSLEDELWETQRYGPDTSLPPSHANAHIHAHKCPEKVPALE